MECRSTDAEALLIVGNANVGDVKHYYGKFNAYQRTYVLTEFDLRVSPRFIFHYAKAFLKMFLEGAPNKAAMSYIVLGTLKDFKDT